MCACFCVCVCGQAESKLKYQKQAANKLWEQHNAHKLQLQLNYKNGGSKNHKKIANLCGLRSNIVGGGKHSKNSREFIRQVHEANLRQQCGRIRNICKPIRKYFCIWKRCTQIQSANILGNSKAHSHAYFIGLHMNIPRLIHSHPLPYLPYVIANLNTKICGT